MKTKISVEWSRIAMLLLKSRPDTGNRYAPRSVQTKGKAQFLLWQEICRVFAYEVCVVQKIVPEKRFYEACGYENDGIKP